MREGDKVQILSGVSPGDEVVVVGRLGLEDKAKVRDRQTRREGRRAGREGRKDEKKDEDKK